MSRIVLSSAAVVKSQATCPTSYYFRMGVHLKDILATNLKVVMEKRGLSESKLSKMTGGEVSQKTINNLKNAKQAATIDTLEQLATALRIDVPLLLQPGFEDDMRTTPSISKLLHNYIDASGEGQLTIARVAEREAEYHLAKKASGE